MRRLPAIFRSIPWRKLSFIFLMGTFFTWLSFTIVHLPFILAAESQLSGLTWVKKMLNQYLVKDHFYDKDFITKHFLLINVNQDNALTYLNKESYKENPDGEYMVSITDRRKLTSVFRYLSENDSLYDYIVCDILFELPSLPRSRSSGYGIYDDSLNYYIHRLSNVRGRSRILFSGVYHPDPPRCFRRSILDEIRSDNVGYVDLDNTDNYFLTFTLSRDELRAYSLPLMMYTRFNDLEVKQKPLGILEVSGPSGHSHYMLNTYIPEMLYDLNDQGKTFGMPQADMDPQDQSASLIYLNDAARMPDYSLYPMLAGGKAKKTIVIGAFDDRTIDKHQTIYGITTGGLLLLNVYNSLLSHQNAISIYLILFLFACYCIFFALSIFRSKPMEPISSCWGNVYRHVWSEIDYVFLVFITVVSFFIFHVVVGPIALLGLLTVSRFFIRKYLH